ncbi:uncharacterized protein I303_101386 [Kwoniella dejecticola CBS 10117]|uniref:Uncharacterized protein n=1 Tax=Kwoniella dejecticola CBS 10117 TaxID=1296121 RepID=A0A1A6AHL9_9TREE|nr:uncharacterized protein I303_01395 [Kwoniella dejecticola CBS 10117]OBR89567.1 hypothetical protein I303_01395 [Kwoniella dejecticola CBS 10117]
MSARILLEHLGRSTDGLTFRITSSDGHSEDVFIAREHLPPNLDLSDCTKDSGLDFAITKTSRPNLLFDIKSVPARQGETIVDTQNPRARTNAESRWKHYWQGCAAVWASLYLLSLSSRSGVSHQASAQREWASEVSHGLVQAAEAGLPNCTRFDVHADGSNPYVTLRSIEGKIFCFDQETKAWKNLVEDDGFFAFSDK